MSNLRTSDERQFLTSHHTELFYRHRPAVSTGTIPWGLSYFTACMSIPCIVDELSMPDTSFYAWGAVVHDSLSEQRCYSPSLLKSPSVSLPQRAVNQLPGYAPHNGMLITTIQPACTHYVATDQSPYTSQSPLSAFGLPSVISAPGHLNNRYVLIKWQAETPIARWE